jgi:DNA replication protein DnaC
LTKQQKEILGTNGNLIVSGRSGTGKTILSILRLYAIEYFANK